MEEKGVPQMIVTDPVAIYYLIGVKISPGERLLVLYLNINGTHRIMINELFPQSKEVGVEIIWYNDMQDGVKMLSSLVETGKIIGIDKSWSAGFLLRLQELCDGCKFVNGSTIVDGVRKIKDAKEIELLRESSRINDKVMERLVPLVAKGYTEKELDIFVRNCYKEYGCEGVSFSPITAYGVNGADPHHKTDNSKGVLGDGIVLDIGGFKNHYASDMTRTVFLGTVSQRQRDVYEVVKEAQLRGIAAAKPGNRMKDVDKACRDYITEKGFGPYFTHRTGHSCGLEDHEYGDVSSANDDVICIGQCFSIEPGIYLPDESIGVRIEDLVIITEKGCEVLTRYTKDLIVVEP